MNAAPCQKDTYFKSLCTTSFYVLGFNGIANVMDFVWNKLCIDTSAAFQEAQFQANIIEDNIIYMDNLHPMEFVSSRGKDTQFNLNNAFKG